MGEIAEMMADGSLCESCGSFIDFDGADGVPRYCSMQCARDRGANYTPTARRQPAVNPAKTNCPVCTKRLKKVGLSDHLRDSHPFYRADPHA